MPKATGSDPDHTSTTEQTAVGMQAYDIAAFRALLAAYESERDFSEWLTGLVAGVAAHVGGPYRLTAGRSGSWESARIVEWMQSAGCEIPEEVEYLRERWAPADPAVTVTLPQQITGEQGDTVGPERTVTLDVTDDDAYYVLTDALEDWAHQRRCDAEDERATGCPVEWSVAHYQRMAAIADAMLERVNADT